MICEQYRFVDQYGVIINRIGYKRQSKQFLIFKNKRLCELTPLNNIPILMQLSNLLHGPGVG